MQQENLSLLPLDQMLLFKFRKILLIKNISLPKPTSGECSVYFHKHKETNTVLRVWIPLPQGELYLDSRQTFADFLVFAAVEALAQLYTVPLEIPTRKKERCSSCLCFSVALNSTNGQQLKLCNEFLHESVSVHTATQHMQ